MSDDQGTDGSSLQPRGLAALAYSGIAALAYSGIVVVGLAAVTLAGVAGAADASSRLGALKPLTYSAGNGMPPHSSRTASRKLARRLIKEAELPPGAARLTKLPRALRDLGDGVISYHKVDIYKVFWEQRSFNRAVKFVSSHHPDGWTSEGVGSSCRVVHGKKVYYYKQVTFTPRRLPAADDLIEMQISVVPRHGHSLIRVDLAVIWYPRRSAAEQLIASHFRSVTATVWRQNQKPHHVTRTFRQRAIIDRLTKVINSTEASPGSPFISCPLIDTEYALTFHGRGHQEKVRIDANGCYSLTIKVGGHWQPALVDNGQIEGIIRHLLHLRPEHLPISNHPVKP